MTPDEDEYRFELDAAYTPETIPMDRLAEYMAAVAALLATSSSSTYVHFDRLVPGSVGLVARVQSEAIIKVEERVQMAPLAEEGTELRKVFTRIDTLAREDNASASLRSRRPEQKLDRDRFRHIGAFALALPYEAGPDCSRRSSRGSSAFSQSLPPIARSRSRASDSVSLFSNRKLRTLSLSNSQSPLSSRCQRASPWKRIGTRYKYRPIFLRQLFRDFAADDPAIIELDQDVRGLQRLAAGLDGNSVHNRRLGERPDALRLGSLTTGEIQDFRFRLRSRSAPVEIRSTGYCHIQSAWRDYAIHGRRESGGVCESVRTFSGIDSRNPAAATGDCAVVPRAAQRRWRRFRVSVKGRLFLVPASRSSLLSDPRSLR